MNPTMQQQVQEAEQRRQARGVDAASVSDEEIKMRGDHAKEITETQLRQVRELAQLRAKEKAAKADAK